MKEKRPIIKSYEGILGYLLNEKDDRFKTYFKDKNPLEKWKPAMKKVSDRLHILKAGLWLYSVVMETMS